MEGRKNTQVMVGQKHVEKNTCAQRDRLFSFYHPDKSAGYGKLRANALQNPPAKAAIRRHSDKLLNMIESFWIPNLDGCHPMSDVFK